MAISRGASPPSACSSWRSRSRMPSYAFLFAPLQCPTCATVLGDLIWFQWGFTAWRQPIPESTYVIGDAIRWRTCRDGRTHAWTYFMRNGNSDGGNLGTPDEPNVIVRDW